MRSLCQLGAVLLIFLALLKLIGMAYLLVLGNSEHPSFWYVKQSIYAIAAASIGTTLLRSGKTGPESEPTEIKVHD